MPQAWGQTLGYVDDENAEWLVSGSDVALGDNTLFRRPHGGTWQPIGLPPFRLTNAQRACSPGTTVVGEEAEPPTPVFPIRVWTAGGDTWVEGVFGADDTCGTAAMLLRTRPVDEPLSFWR
jgi:hypothetical protein